jgi:hypothetical protein
VQRATVAAYTEILKRLAGEIITIDAGYTIT